MRRRPKRLRQQVRIIRLKSPCLDAMNDPGPQSLIRGSLPRRPLGLTRCHEESKSIVVRVIESELYVRMHPAFQNGDGIFALLRNDCGRGSHQRIKALLRETKEDLIFIAEMPVDGCWRITDLPR